MSKRNKRTALFSCLLLCLLIAPVAGAQTVTPDQVPELTIDRDADELKVDMKPRPDLDTTNTALIFTNPTNWRPWIRCVAFGRNGNALGRTHTVLPPKGLRYIRASDFTNGVDFVGHVECTANSKVIGSAILLGPGITDLAVKHSRSDNFLRIRFPVVAHF